MREPLPLPTRPVALRLLDHPDYHRHKDRNVGRGLQGRRVFLLFLALVIGK